MNKIKFHSVCIKILFFGEVISRKGVHLDPRKVHVLTKMPTLIIKRTAVILGIRNY